MSGTLREAVKQGGGSLFQAAQAVPTVPNRLAVSLDCAPARMCWRWMGPAVSRQVQGLPEAFAHHYYLSLRRVPAGRNDLSRGKSYHSSVSSYGWAPGAYVLLPS